ncbi:hypothetical protein [Stutzerimonas nitrititolerans]|uniref:hypothetical protein n=1 Tax=Stutzerimonas nitrititolerans TaxID=2482751 RepID=UPI0028967DCA|nr:hypothetical protein [Stutzerimonas nitrititolerans]
MAAANVLPLNAEITAPRHAPRFVVLTPALAEGLRLVNDMARRLRAADIRIESASPLDTIVLIATADADRFEELFSSKSRGVSWTTVGKHARKSVYLGGVRVAWLVPAKEQGHD